MKSSKLSESQLIAMLNEGKAGVAVSDICRKYGIANSTYYKLKAKYNHMGMAELTRLKQLERESRQLKKMYADLSLDHTILKEVLEKKYPGLTD